jgi:hypothetical protein
MSDTKYSVELNEATPADVSDCDYDCDGDRLNDDNGDVDGKLKELGK